MRILLVPSSDWNSPVPVRMKFIFGELAKKGYQIHVLRFCLKDSDFPGKISPGFTVHSVPVPFAARLGEVIYYVLGFPLHLAAIRRIALDCRVDAIVTSNLLPGLAASLVGKFYDIPVIYDLVDYFPGFLRRYRVPRFLLPPLERILETILSVTAKSCRAVVTPSFSLGTLVRNRYLKSDGNLFVIPNGVDPEIFSPGKVDRNATRRKLGVSHEVIVGLVGTLEFWLDFDFVFRFLSNLRRLGITAKLMLVGSAPYGQAAVNKTIDSLKTKYSLGDSDIIACGLVPHEAVPELIAGMDICLLPFNSSVVAQTSCPIKLFEYLSMGKLIVSTPIIDVSRIAQDVAIMGNADITAERVSARLLSANDASLASLARRNIAMRYSWSSVAEEFGNLVVRTLSQR